MGANMDVYHNVLDDLVTFDFLPLVAFRCKVEDGYFHVLPLFWGHSYVKPDITMVE